MKILVTGANGYIGSKVVKELLNLGECVVATDLYNNNIDGRAKFLKADIFSKNDNWFEFFEKPDVCLHLAWRDGFIHNSDYHMRDLSSHYNFLTSLVNSGLHLLAVMGTMHEVGYFEGAIKEDTPCKPLSQYGISKNALRQSLELFTYQKKCKFMWLRAFYIYGDDSYGNSVFCKIRQAVEKGEKYFPFTLGQNEYDFIHINDLAFQISQCVIQEKVLGIINVCSGKPTKLSDKVMWYIETNKLPIKLDFGKFPERPYDSPCVYGDNSKITKILGGN